MSRIYTSFEQIDNDLKILKLKKDIDWVCLKTDYQSILRNLSVRRIFSDVRKDTQNFLSAKKEYFLGIAADFLWKRFFKK